MPLSPERHIHAAEEQLRQAMLHSDVASLDRLIADDLIFTTHFGTVVTKQEDLAVHRSGELKFHAIEPSEQKVMILGQAAYVCVRMALSGMNNGSPFRGDFRFSRVWHMSGDNTWQVVAGQVTAVQGA
jgi:ketosteroid isomerase-like protein